MAKMISFMAILMGSVSLSANVGDICGLDSQCGIQEQCVTEFDQGYCVLFDCSQKNPCSAGSTCMMIEPENFTLCLKTCTKNSDCRMGYQCYEQGVCLP